MKKSLYLTSALVAASVLALGSTATMAASKAKPMKLAVSGSYKVLVGYAKQSSGFTNTGTDTVQTTYNAMDIKTDSEIHFKGSTKTDAGVTVGVAIQLETDQTKNASAHIDGSEISFSGGFGKLALGSTSHAAAILAVSSPSTGAIGYAGGDSGEWIVRPGASAVSPVAGHNIGGNDDMKIRWTSNAFSGFSVGASYKPSKANAGTMPANGGNGGNDASTIDGGIKYSGKMGKNAISASLGYWSDDAGTADLDGISAGVSTTMGAVTVGATWKDISSEGKNSAGAPITGTSDSKDEEAYTVGVSWTQGSTTLSLNYYKTEMELAAATAGEDSLERWTLGAKYAMGPGVDFLGTVQNVKWGDESNTATDNNKGVAIIGGIKVAF